MAELRAFRGVRYTPAAGPIGMLTAPPYDAIAEEQRQRLASRSPRNVVHLILPQGGGDRYRVAAERFERWARDGFLAQERDPALYLYRQTFKGPDGRAYVRTGFLGLVRLEPEGGSVRRHERTLPGPLEDRLRLLRAARVQFSPVFLLYSDPDGAALRALEGRASAERPGPRPVGGTGFGRRTTELTPGAALEFNDDDGVRHWLQPITDAPAIEQAQRRLAALPVVIADGHHRWSAALEFSRRMAAAFPDGDPDLPENFMLACFVRAEDPGLIVHPTHRVVRALPGDPPLDAPALLRSFSARFEIQSLDLPAASHAAEAPAPLKYEPSRRVVIGARLAGDPRLHVLLLRPGDAPFEGTRLEEPLRGLDVAALHSLILEPEFGIDPEAPERGGRLVYERDPAVAASMVASGEAKAAFFLRPIAPTTLFDIAAHDLAVPPRTTWFAPKLATGLVMHRLGV